VRINESHAIAPFVAIMKDGQQVPCVKWADLYTREMVHHEPAEVRWHLTHRDAPPPQDLHGTFDEAVFTEDIPARLRSMIPEGARVVPREAVLR